MMLSNQLEYYKELVKAVINAANSLHYDNAATLLTLGCDYGPCGGKEPEAVIEAWNEMNFYINFSSESFKNRKFACNADPHIDFFEPAIIRLKRWLADEAIKELHQLEQ